MCLGVDKGKYEREGYCDAHFPRGNILITAFTVIDANIRNASTEQMNDEA